MDKHSSHLPGLSAVRATFSSMAGSQLRLSFGGQQRAGVLSAAHVLHPDVAEVRQTLVIGGFLPQPGVGSLRARRGMADSGREDRRVGEGPPNRCECCPLGCCSGRLLSPALKEDFGGCNSITFTPEEAEAQ